MSKVKSAINSLRNGGLVIAPTDTVYGALVDATNQQAVEKLIQFKQRPKGKPISVFVSDFQMLQEYVEVNRSQLAILKTILPGPFTVVLKSKKKVIPLLESEDSTVGVRLINHPFISNLIKQFGKPITATSANLSGQGSNYDIDSLMESLSQKKKNFIDIIINEGKLPKNKPSTVIDLTKPEIKIIRQGDGKMSNVKTQMSKVTKSEVETKKIAQKILEKMLRATGYILHKPLVFILEGDLGVGKTIFVKGIGEYLGIQNIISPTFVVYYEYDINKSKIKNQKSKFIHVDLYNVEKEEEFKHLGIEKYLKPGNILCIEWGEKAGKIFNILKEEGSIVFVKMKYINAQKRAVEFLY